MKKILIPKKGEEGVRKFYVVVREVGGGATFCIPNFSNYLGDFFQTF